MNITLNDLPNDVKKYLLLPLLDNISRLLLKNALIGAFEKLPRELNKQTQKDICKYDIFFFYRYQDYVDKRKIMKYCAINGNTELLEELKTKYLINSEVINAAAKYGNFETFKWAYKNNCSINAQTIHKAILSGNLEILQWFIDNGYKFNSSITTSAAESGNLNILKWTLDKVYDFSQFTYYAAVRGGHLDILKFLNSQKAPAPWNFVICEFAAQCKKWTIFKWLITNDYPYNSTAYNYVIAYGDVELVKWMEDYNKNIILWNYNSCYIAAFHNKLDILIFARDNNHLLTKDLCYGAAENGNLEILKWARENGCDWDEWVCAKAAQYGHLHVLIWARENGCNWDHNTCDFAATHDKINTLKWAKENGASWSNNILEHPMGRCNAEVEKYITENML